MTTSESDSGATTKRPKKKAGASDSAGSHDTSGDSTGAEFEHFVCNLVPSTGTDTDWGLGAAFGGGALTATTAPPKAADLRQPWWGIGNQESTGSCVGWATADGVGRYTMVTAGKLPQSGRLSPRFTWMASKETDEFPSPPTTFIEQSGTSLKAAVETAKRYGFALESELPFHISTTMVSGDPNAFYASCARRKIASYFNLRRNLDDWRVWLSSKGPLLVGLSVDSNFDTAASRGGKIDSFAPSTVRGGHAVCVVGYRADGRFIVRNSWGTSWGDQGFGYVSAAYISKAFFDESYGVSVT
jgi:hypothetical protein